MTSIQEGDGPNDVYSPSHVYPNLKQDSETSSEREPDEYTPLLDSAKAGRLGDTSKSSLTDSEVKRVVNETDVKSPTCLGRWCEPRWRSIYIMYFTMFLSAVTFSIVLSSIWPYLLQVDYTNASASFLGWVVAAYSFGQLVASPVFGFWADKRPTREPLLVALVINVVFSLLYCYCGAIPAGIAGYILIVARAMVGFGAAVAAIVRSYVSEATFEKERTGAMAGVSSAQALGFILGPALGLAFVPLGSDGVEIKAIRFHLNMYTGPGYLSALMGIINIVLLIFFKEAKLPEAKRRAKTEDNIRKMTDPRLSDVESDGILVGRRHFDRLAAGTMVVLFFVILFVFAVFETIATPLSMDEFAWSRQQAILYNNAFFAALAIIAIITFISVKLITKYVDERVALMVALFLMAFSFFIMLPMGDEPPQLAISTDEAATFDGFNHTWIQLRNSSGEVIGCRDPPQYWCPFISRIYLVQYILALMLLAVGYPTGNLLSYSIYSKILGPFPQGTMMGILTAAGSLARALGPMSVTALYQHVGPTVTFASVVGILACAVILLLVLSYRLKPYRS